MEITHVNSNLKIADDSFLWRYMSFPKMFDLISENLIYFTRLDVFDDPLEGMNAKDRFKLHLNNISKLESDEDDPIIHMKKAGLLTTKAEEVKKWQEGIFASCWYLTEEKSEHHESLAMWELYADKYSFVIKVSFKDLLQTLSQSLEKFEDDEISQVCYGKVSYLSLYEQSILGGDGSRIYPSLIKDKSFKYENELRFLLLREKKSDKYSFDRKGIKIPLSNKLSNLSPKVEILAHPDMDLNVFKIFKLKFLEFGFEIKYSTLLTRSVVNSLIQ